MAGPDAVVLEVRTVSLAYGGRTSLFGARKTKTLAVDGVTLGLRSGETVGIVGESGSGKSTLARMLVGLLAPGAGAVALDGEMLDARRKGHRRRLMRRAQFVFQDAAGAFNPRRTVGRSLEAPLIGLTDWPAARRRERVAELLERVGLSPDHAGRFPHQFSGGQLQRAGIARALGPEPEIVVLDEPVSALDVSIQAQILTLLRRLKAETGLTMAFVSHDLAVVESLCDRVVVMRGGRIVEQGACREVLSRPREDYTKNLIAAAGGRV